MYLLDTNVLSESMKARPALSVIQWLDTQQQRDLFYPATSHYEILWGIAQLDDGKRKQTLTQLATDVFSYLDGRCLHYTCEVAEQHAAIQHFCKTKGRGISQEDAMIAAIAQTHKLILVTRNTKDFDYLPELSLLNPWQ